MDTHKIKIKYKLIHPLAKIPTKRKGDAGYDLYAVEDAEIFPMQRLCNKIGLKIEIPEGYYGRIAPRSGSALKAGIDVLAGVVDATYRGEVGVILINLTEPPQTNSIIGHPMASCFPRKEGFKIKAGDKIAQIVFEECHEAEFEEGELSDTERKEGGFGSTGR